VLREKDLVSFLKPDSSVRAGGKYILKLSSLLAGVIGGR
jgi:hypothetical protein